MPLPDVISRRIEALDSQRQQLLESLREVDEELAVQRALLARHANDQLPVSTLPHDLLTDILLQLQHQELNLKKVSAAHKPGIEFIASQVSCQWRQAALSTPLLWRTIRMQVKPPKREASLAHLNARLVRSNPCPLDVYLALHVSNDPLESQFYQTLASHSNRWRKLSLISEQGPLSQVDLNPIIFATDAVQLELFSFAIRTLSGLPAPPPSHRPVVNFGSDKLTTVRLEGKVTRHFHLPFTHVTTLHLVACPITILHEAPLTLQHLSLTDMMSIGQLTNPIALPNLSSLRVISNFTANVINWLTMPRLRSLTLDQLPHFDWSLEHPLPTVKYLAFNSCSTSASVTSSLLLSLPSVETLSINGGHMERFLAGLAATDNTDAALHYKSLSKLSLFDIERRGVELLTTIVFVRCFSRERDDSDNDSDGSEQNITNDSNTGNNHWKRLTHLTLDNRTKSGIRATPGKLDWLQERLTVESVQFPEAWPPVTVEGESEGRSGTGYPYLHPSEKVFWDSVWFMV
ncbi:hypothetical protein BJ165DRAFT_1398423 [Panaeolus papilionaceus]|nr:hypothetical protein BJ165DRAFT_1398423 [Panaeolus papilionaceus]